MYLKEVDTRGFVIYSNWSTSRKASDIRSNPQACLAFWWPEVERQVRVEGIAEKLGQAESQEYFKLRARGSKIGAWASEQSTVLQGPGDGREALETRVLDFERRFENVPDEDIEVPEHWGGLRIVPHTIEFWQGRDSRLHDRFRYLAAPGSAKSAQEVPEQVWRIERLSP